MLPFGDESETRNSLRMIDKFVKELRKINQELKLPKDNSYLRDHV